jgi:5-oxoprolinase (ATP-hydrolysing)
LDTGGTFTDLIGRAPDGSMRRAKVPSDGSIIATVVACEDATLRVRPSAGLEIPDGFLEGWAIEPSAIREVGAPSAPTGVRADREIRVTGQRGNALRLSAAAQLEPGRPVRLVQSPSTTDAPRLGLHILTRTPLDQPLPPIELRLSTTRGTNALLEGRGARVGVLVSQGLTGVVTIGDQTRPDLFARVPIRPRAIAHATRELPERSFADGTAEHAATPDICTRAAQALRADGCEAVVVSLAHALTNARETDIADALRASGFDAISARSVAPHPRLLTRTETACIHAQIAPIVRAFVDDATRSAHGARAFVFTSAGVLQRADRLLARDTLYSGPAGGARAVCDVAQRHGMPHAVGFDMGGTSSDVSRTVDGEIALRAESRIAQRTVAAPSVAIDSVAAGGGSICRIHDGAFEVGPRSAGSNPGPACYGRGGPLTITDVNLLAGRMATGEGSMSLDMAAAERALSGAAAERGVSPEMAMQAFLEIADARMALAIEALCVRDGVDPRRHALVAFGGAGGQHACAIADRLEIDTIVFPRFAGFLSASGVLAAVPARFATVPVLRPLEEIAPRLAELRAQAVSAARAELTLDRFDGAIDESVEVRLRLAGQEAAIAVGEGDVDTLRTRFDARFRELFGYAPPERAIEVVSVEARVAARERIAAAGREDSVAARPSNAPSIARILTEGRWLDASLYARPALAAGDTVPGPAVITDAGETVVIDRSWRAKVDASGDLVASRIAPRAMRVEAAEQELFAARLESIALAMGHVLERTALSPNIRDRLDFSCAVLDGEGRLIQNAPHLPVHLGALGICTRAVMDALPMAEGDIAVTNHPAFGGSHLPDVTTIAPVHVDGARVAFVAVRAHHAEIGGTRPGSFPPDASNLAEEGVVLPPFLAVRAGVFDREEAKSRFTTARHPSRNPDENIADLEAQIAATRHGVAQVAALACERRAGFAIQCERELERAARALSRVLASLPREARTAHVALDDGSNVVAHASLAQGEGAPMLRLSFEGSAGEHPRNFNAPVAVTRAATLYVLRLLIDEPIPMNEGLLRPLALEVPRGILNPSFTADPLRCPPVVAGNVETSQSVVAALVAMFGIAAESQSTMNNTLFGNDRFTIYETLGGGAGAGERSPGASAVHVHMSNTRLTDIDVLERRAPVLIRRFELRTGSGGRGLHVGGDGLTRTYEFLAPISLSFFGSRRRVPPRGACGGCDGATGMQVVRARGVERTSSESVLSIELAPGDRFTVHTPGGGGWGTPRA